MSHKKNIWKGSHNPILRGRKLAMVINHLLTGVISKYDMGMDRGTNFHHLVRDQPFIAGVGGIPSEKWWVGLVEKGRFSENVLVKFKFRNYREIRPDGWGLGGKSGDLYNHPWLGR